MNSFCAWLLMLVCFLAAVGGCGDTGAKPQPFDPNKQASAKLEAMKRLADEMASPYLDPFQVKLIPASDPRSQAAADIHRRFPAGPEYGRLFRDQGFRSLAKRSAA